MFVSNLFSVYLKNEQSIVTRFYSLKILSILECALTKSRTQKYEISFDERFGKKCMPVKNAFEQVLAFKL